MHPTEDQTPLRLTIPDAAWFPCPHCGRALKCPPVAKPARRTGTALIPKAPTGVIAEELAGDPNPLADTIIIEGPR